MPGNGNGKNGRIHDLDAARSWERLLKSVEITPDQAHALIDGVLRSYGLDPTRVTDPYGWRHLSLGSVDGIVGVVEWQPDTYYLAVVVPILEVPADPEGLAGFYKGLLELNHDGTLAAHFSIYENRVFVGLTRPIRGLDEEEVEDAIRAVLIVADSYDEWLKAELAAALALIPPELPDLPNIKMTPREAGTVGAVLSACDVHGQEIFRYLMERWYRSGFIVDPGSSGNSFKVQLDSERYSLASIRPGVGERRQLIVLGWEGLRRRGIFSREAVDRFQAAVSKITALQATESTAHLEVTEAFDKQSARRLLKAWRDLARAARPSTEEAKFEWDPDLPPVELKVGEKTLAGIQETLQACEVRVQRIYARLIEGWNQAGGTVQCSRPGRVYLKLKSREHEFGEYGRQSHLFNLAVLVAPRGKRGPAIEVSWNLATREYAYLDYAPEAVARFEARVAGLPGFEQQGTVTRLLIGEGFQEEHAERLLQALLDLKAAAGERR
jgi:hypothetical protein